MLTLTPNLKKPDDVYAALLSAVLDKTHGGDAAAFGAAGLACFGATVATGLVAAVFAATGLAAAAS